VAWTVKVTDEYAAWFTAFLPGMFLRPEKRNRLPDASFYG
jgi:hypothetical protein